MLMDSVGQKFGQDTVGTNCLFSQRLGPQSAGGNTMAGGWNHLEVSFLTCPVVEGGRQLDLSWAVGPNTYL